MPNRTLTNKVAPAYKVHALVTYLQERGVSPVRILHGTGLGEVELDSVSTRVSQAQQVTVFRNAMRCCPDPALALLAGRRLQITSYGYYGYGLLSSPTLREALLFSTKYQPTVLRTVSMQLVEERETARFVLQDLLQIPDVALFNMEFQLAVILAIFRDMMSTDFRFSEARLAYPAPAHAQHYSEILECPVRFDCDSTEYRFPAGLLAVEMPRRNPIAREMALRLCDQALTEADASQQFSFRVRRMLLESMGNFPSIDEAASHLNMCSRTLRRKLSAEGASFQRLLDQVRQGLAMGYLRQADMTTEEIADRLDYGNAANFRHAFKRWTGSTPGAYRQHLRSQAVSE